MLRALACFAMLGLAAISLLLAGKSRESAAHSADATATKAPKPPPPALPIGQVVLFSSGVGYYQREGEVENNSRVDLSFPGSDINDLLKSLVLQDQGGGNISTITYDSADPVEKTLKSFALDLTNNPTFGQILNQARGEKVEIGLPQNGAITGTIVGMETRRLSDKEPEVDVLNLSCEDGMRTVVLNHMQRVRFLNSTLESEFKRALDILSATHDTQKKSVSLHFDGKGKRKVRVGYVVEHPIWKTSYRLVLDDKKKPFLQGWAMVENTSDEDWKDVSMALVSGRPISFQMGLYEALYAPRPWVEPDLFASLRPPVFNGSMNNMAQLGVGSPQALGGLGAFGIGGGLGGGLAGLGGAGFGQHGLGAGLGQVGQSNLGIGGGLAMQGTNRYQNSGNQFGMQGQGFYRPPAYGQITPGINPAGGAGDIEDESPSRRMQGSKLSYEELLQRRREQNKAKEDAKKVGSSLAAIDPKEGMATLATGEDIGDRFQYLINKKVNLPRQKSALLPIINADVEATKLSIFNPAVHPKFPVLGLRFKNTTGHPLVQGPVTVYEGGAYAGDARIMDMQVKEDRLIGYAMDLGIEIKLEQKKMPPEMTSIKLEKGIMKTGYMDRLTSSYTIKSRAANDRILLIEQPIRPQWKLITPEKPLEQSSELNRFQITVPAGKGIQNEIVEEMTSRQVQKLASANEQLVHFYAIHPAASPAVKEAFRKALAMKDALAKVQSDLSLGESEAKVQVDDQARLRSNLAILPKDSAAYKNQLTKFDAQEPEIEKAQAEVKRLRQAVMHQQIEYDTYLANLTAE